MGRNDDGDVVVGVVVDEFGCCYRFVAALGDSVIDVDVDVGVGVDRNFVDIGDALIDDDFADDAAVVVVVVVADLFLFQAVLEEAKEVVEQI